MELYIETENGQIKNHPAFEDNLIQAFGAVPEQWEPFTRVERPSGGIYQKIEGPAYAKIDGVWTDVWTVQDITLDEKIAKQQSVINAFNARRQAENWSAWALDESTCTMAPPIPPPDPIEGKNVFWCGTENNWKETPARPEGNYQFDFFTWDWVTV
jgi:hypothetical protein